VHVEFVVGRYRPDRDGVSAYVQRLTAALGEVGVVPVVTEWPGIRRWRPARQADVVHVQFAPSAFGYSGGIGLLPLAARRPVVTTLHEYGWWTWQPSPPQSLWRGAHRLAERTRRWDRETLLLAPASRELIVTGAGHADTVRSRLGREPHVIPIGANVEASYGGSREEARRELRLQADTQLLVFFGFVHPVKGLRYLLEALAELRAGVPALARLQLAVVGGWRSLAWPDDEADAFVAELRALAQQLGVAEAVTFTGFLADRDASRWLTAAHVAVLPFTHGVTAKSGSLLTCWSHRLPVVATSADGGDPDVAGAVLPAATRDVPTLRDAVARALSDPGERNRLSAAGEARMAERRWPAVATAHRRLYERLVQDAVRDLAVEAAAR
jgi:glycosyltransferase involved in cell wall biosynthesis